MDNTIQKQAFKRIREAMGQGIDRLPPPAPPEQKFVPSLSPEELEALEQAEIAKDNARREQLAKESQMQLGATGPGEMHNWHDIDPSVGLRPDPTEGVGPAEVYSANEPDPRFKKIKANFRQ